MCDSVMNIRNMNNLTIAYLLQGYFIPFEIIAKAEQLDNLETAGAKAASAQITNLQKEIADLSNKYSEIKRQIEDFTKDKRLVHVLELRYISGLQLKDIAKRLQFSCDWTQRLHTKAVKAFGAYLVQNGIAVE